jgi:protein O-mannosyl-transferase
LMFAPILWVYIFLFEKNLTFIDIFKAKRFKEVFSSILLALPALILAAVLYKFQQKMTAPTFIPSHLSVYNYMISMPFVWLYYFKSFFLPNTLSADYDWVALQSAANWRFFVGMLFIIVLVVVIFITSKKKSTRPIAFGLAWFILALIPSSTVIPFAEILNDHRVFYPYVGLMISVCWSIFLMLKYFEKEIKSNVLYKFVIAIYMLLIIGGNAYATHERNKVWKTDETLWKDVTIKSPQNGRGLMNYGLTQMAIGKFDIALFYFEKAQEITPYYATLYVNLAVCKGAVGRIIEAENDYKKAMEYGATEQAPFYFYGNFLVGKGRMQESIGYLQKAVENGPNYMDSRYLLMQVYSQLGMFKELEGLANQTLQIVPGDATTLTYLNTAKNKPSISSNSISSKMNPEEYLNLSLQLYNQGKFQDCIDASEKAIRLKPDYAEAYNNICAAYNSIGEYRKAKKACEEAIRLKPDYELAKNNLNLSLSKLGSK